MIESNFLTLGGGGYQQMELVIAYALTILVTIAVIVLVSHRKQIKNRGTSGGSSDLSKAMKRTPYENRCQPFLLWLISLSYTLYSIFNKKASK